VKHSRNVLVNQVELALKQIVLNICAAQEIEVEEMKTDKDPIHLHLSMKPQHSISSVVKTLKGKSARRLFKLHPEMKQLLWVGTYVESWVFHYDSQREYGGTSTEIHLKPTTKRIGGETNVSRNSSSGLCVSRNTNL
jgi:putative transposase